MRAPKAPGGIALIITILAMAAFSAIGLGLLVATAIDRATTFNHRDGVEALLAAESALELSVNELAAIADWSTVLNGSRRSRFVDGVPAGVRSIPGGAVINLTSLTNELTCGRSTGCTDAETRVSTSERPWGSNNPRWQLFLYGRLRSYVSLTSPIDDSYIVTWIGDDAREVDGSPMIDGVGPGRLAVRIRAAAFGRHGARRAIEADLIGSSSGIHVHSWRLMTTVLP